MGEWAQLITSIATLIAALGAILIGWRNLDKIGQVAGKVEEVHKATNGLTTKLVDLTATSSLAKGNLEGRAELKEEQGSV